MKENNDNKLTVTMENGNAVEIEVIDIIESPEFNKQFIVYTFPSINDENFYASILDETDTTFSLNAIETKEELDFVEKKIEELAKDLSNEVE